MQAYVDRFEYLARIYSQNMSKEWRCKNFERGLRHNIMKVIVPMRIREFPLLVEQAKIVEQLEVDPSRVMRTHHSSNDREKRQEKPYNKPQCDGQGTVKCFECGGDHYRRNCLKFSGEKSDERKCYICRKPDHYTNACPERGKSEEPQQQQKTPREKPKAVGRVFAMSGAETGNLIEDTCFLLTLFV